MAKLIMLVGLSGSGKSTFAKNYVKLKGGKIFSSDAIRKELYGDERVQRNHNKVFEILHSRIKESLKNGVDSIYDATNLSMKNRKAFLETLNKIDCEKICVIVATPFEKCVEQDLNRERTVGNKVIHKQRCSFQCPYFYEGWDEINILNEEKENIEYLDSLYNDSKKIRHDNPHHTETIGNHMKNAMDCCISKANAAFEVYKKVIEGVGFDTSTLFDKKTRLMAAEPIKWLFLEEVAMYHDIGKLFTKEFKDSKGNKTEFAHYYNHQNVSAYEIISHIGSGSFKKKITDTPFESCYGIEKEFKVAIIVNWHMQPFFSKIDDYSLVNENKSWKKFEDVVGKDIAFLLLRFHMVDTDSH